MLYGAVWENTAQSPKTSILEGKNNSIRKRAGFSTLPVLLFSLAVQRQVLFVALECVHTGNIVQNAFILHNVGGRYVLAVIYHKQHIFLFLNTISRYFIAEVLCKQIL